MLSKFRRHSRPVNSFFVALHAADAASAFVPAVVAVDSAFVPVAASAVDTVDDSSYYVGDVARSFVALVVSVSIVVNWEPETHPVASSMALVAQCLHQLTFHLLDSHSF